LNNSPRDAKIIIGELYASFERQLALYTELRDSVRANMSKLILSRGDAGVLMAGVDRKKKLIDRLDEERAGIAPHIEYWQENGKALASGDGAAGVNEVLTRIEGVIKEFLAEEEKLKQYVEKIFKNSGGNTGA